MEEKTLDALSLICQAVLLDHNYNATLPPDSPTRSLPTPNPNSQMNGVSSTSMYSPGSNNEIYIIIKNQYLFLHQAGLYLFQILYLLQQVYRLYQQLQVIVIY